MVQLNKVHQRILAQAPGKHNKLFFQPKHKIGPVGDPCEHEADAVADKIMSRPAPVISKVSAVPTQCKCAACEEEEQLQRKEKGDTEETEAPSFAGGAINNGGSPLDGSTRSFMERRFGYNFSRVRIHTDTVAAKSAQSINALAYTSGRDIVFNKGQYLPATTSGKKLLAHELTHIVQQNGRIQKHPVIQRQPVQAPTQAQLNQLCYDSGVPQPVPSARNPELHPTYAGWIGSFTGLTTFRSNDTVSGQTARSRFNVLGTAGRRYGDSTATLDTEPVPVTGSAASGEEFIDHPTNQWVLNCLPANLRATAYQLPADCADIAVILRHVWLAAHHRTETYNQWTVGDRTGAANQPRARRLIRDVFTGNVRSMVNAYANAQGQRLRNFNTLQDLLHVGDVLVWEHRKVVRNGTQVSTERTGGHTQTINNITRSGSTITAINVLQGNQPIFSDAATAILSDRGARNTDPDSPAGMALRNLPGRRVEASTAISIRDIRDPVSGQDLWGSISARDSSNRITKFTTLVAAGPPRAAARPAAARGGRRITDWRSAIRRASRAALPGVLEASLQEARSILEQGASATNPVTAADMASLGNDYGNRVHTRLNRNADALMQRVQEVVTVIRALRNDTTNPSAVTPVFNRFEQAFVRQALPQATAEERRLFTEHASLSTFLQPFSAQIAAFSTALSGARNMSQARTIAGQHGASLWQAAITRAQAVTGGSIDDRPLYWSRLRMIESIRLERMRFGPSATERQQLVQLFENASRGIPITSGASVFPSSATGKRILVSGFDPFGLDTSLRDSNPSGAAVLALDGQTVSANNVSAHVEGVVFPVRYRDFDQGLIESFFRPFIDGTHAVNMIMTISQGSTGFDIERWAGRRRSASLPDNEGVISGGSRANPVEPPGLSSGPEFLETGLPHAAMTQGHHAELNTTGWSQDRSTGHAITGTGGGFLSNEIFYRTRLLQRNIGGNALNIPVGHLHVPANMSRQNIINSVRDILGAALQAI